MHSFLDVLAKRGALLDPAAADYLARQDNPVAHFERLTVNLNPAAFLITLEDIQRAEGIGREAALRTVALQAPAPPAPVLAPRSELSMPALRSVARDVSPAADFADDLRVLRDVTGNSTCHGSVQDFARVFTSRLGIVSRILRQRREFQGAVTLERGKTLLREFAFTCIVTDVRTTRNGHKMLIVEDGTASANVIVPNSIQAFHEVVLQDEVIGVVAKGGDRGYLLAEAIFRPEVPNGRPARTIAEDFLVGFMSDIHVGSKTFLDDKWARFIAWANGGDEVSKAMKYLLVSGDVVDGIGIYPRQDAELRVDDVYAQYEELAKRLHDLPDHVRVVLLPGNHDAVRPAEPQPTFPADVRKMFDSQITFLGNPSLFTLHGLKVLAYHGRSMDDWVSSVPGMSYHRPLDVMKEMLRRRHLAPIYGGKTPIAPEAEDYLVIEDVPDVFVTGHVHAVGVEEYKGIHLVNSSTWQAQTSFQKMHNIEPSPACLPLLNVHTGRATIKAF